MRSRPVQDAGLFLATNAKGRSTESSPLRCGRVFRPSRRPVPTTEHSTEKSHCGLSGQYPLRPLATREFQKTKFVMAAKINWITNTRSLHDAPADLPRYRRVRARPQ